MTERCPECSSCKERMKALEVTDFEREKQLESKFREHKIALDLAREQVDHKLYGLNDAQRRMDKLEATFATKVELKATERLVYIGVGLLIALEVFLRVVK